jgi:hypothetical protein
MEYLELSKKGIFYRNVCFLRGILVYKNLQLVKFWTQSFPLSLYAQTVDGEVIEVPVMDWYTLASFVKERPLTFVEFQTLVYLQAVRNFEKERGKEVTDVMDIPYGMVKDIRQGKNKEYLGRVFRRAQKLCAWKECSEE